MVNSFSFQIWRRAISVVLVAALLISPEFSYAQSLFVSQLPEPGTMVNTSPSFTPVLVKGMVIHPDKPLNFDFIVDSGNATEARHGVPLRNDMASVGTLHATSLQQEAVKEETMKMAKYFLAAITVPEDQLWVNLSPYEKDRMIENDLGQTVLGRDMLAQDYLLKQLTASLIYPEKGLGKEFWSKVYEQAQAKFGTTDIPVDTFNKVWIMPEKAEVFEKGNAVYVTQAKLKVMLDSDYYASVGTLHATSLQNAPSQELAKDILREVIIPALEKEVNEGQNFASIRQIFYAAILAKWYREQIQNTLLANAYVGTNKVEGVTTDEKTLKEEIYERYIAAYKKGVFDYIKDDTTITTPRKYFSGGAVLNNFDLAQTTNALDIKPGAGPMFRVAMTMDNAQDTAQTMVVANVDNQFSESMPTLNLKMSVDVATFTEVGQWIQKHPMLTSGYSKDEIDSAMTTGFWIAAGLNALLGGAITLGDEDAYGVRRNNEVLTSIFGMAFFSGVETVFLYLNDAGWVTISGVFVGGFGGLLSVLSYKVAVAAYQKTKIHKKEFLIQYFSKKGRIEKIIPYLYEESGDLQRQAKDVLINMGVAAVPALLESVSFEHGRISRKIADILKEIGYVPQDMNKRILFYEATEQWDNLFKLGAVAAPVLIKHYEWDLLVAMGSDAIPSLVDKWRSDERKSVDLSKVLLKLGWVPAEVIEQVELYRSASQWDSLVAIGEPAVPVLINNGKWEHLFKVGALAIPFLVDEWKNHRNGWQGASSVLYKLGWVPNELSLKIKLYRENAAWGDLIKLGAPAIPVLIEEKQWEALVAIGVPAAPALIALKKWDSLTLIGSSAIPLLALEWQSGNGNHEDLSRVLYKLGWKPQELYKKIDFYEALKNWDELVKIGVLAIPVLVKAKRWDDLVRLGTLGRDEFIDILSKAELEGEYDLYSSISGVLNSIGDSSGRYTYVYHRAVTHWVETSPAVPGYTETVRVSGQRGSSDYEEWDQDFWVPAVEAEGYAVIDVPAYWTKQDRNSGEIVKKIDVAQVLNTIDATMSDIQSASSALSSNVPDAAMMDALMLWIKAHPILYVTGASIVGYNLFTWYVMAYTFGMLHLGFQPSWDDYRHAPGYARNKIVRAWLIAFKKAWAGKAERHVGHNALQLLLTVGRTDVKMRQRIARTVNLNENDYDRLRSALEMIAPEYADIFSKENNGLEVKFEADAAMSDIQSSSSALSSNVPDAAMADAVAQFVANNITWLIPVVIITNLLARRYLSPIPLSVRWLVSGHIGQRVVAQENLLKIGRDALPALEKAAANLEKKRMISTGDVDKYHQIREALDWVTQTIYIIKSRNSDLAQANDSSHDGASDIQIASSALSVNVPDAAMWDSIQKFAEMHPVVTWGGVGLVLVLHRFLAWKMKFLDYVDQLMSSDADERVNAARMLSHRGIGNVGVIKALLRVLMDDPVVAVQQNAAAAIGFHKDKNSVQPLLAKLFRPGTDDAVRYNIILSLQMIHDNSVIEPLIPLLNDPNSEIRSIVAVVFEAFEDLRALEPLRQRVSIEHNHAVGSYLHKAIYQLEYLKLHASGFKRTDSAMSDLRLNNIAIEISTIIQKNPSLIQAVPGASYGDISKALHDSLTQPLIALFERVGELQGINVAAGNIPTHIANTVDHTLNVAATMVQLQQASYQNAIGQETLMRIDRMAINDEVGLRTDKNLAALKSVMNQQYVKWFWASLLHDIGKVAELAKQVPHEKAGYEFLKESKFLDKVPGLTATDKQEIPLIVRYHVDPGLVGSGEFPIETLSGMLNDKELEKIFPDAQKRQAAIDDLALMWVLDIAGAGGGAGFVTNVTAELGLGIKDLKLGSMMTPVVQEAMLHARVAGLIGFADDLYSKNIDNGDPNSAGYDFYWKKFEAARPAEVTDAPWDYFKQHFNEVTLRYINFNYSVMSWIDKNLDLQKNEERDAKFLNRKKITDESVLNSNAVKLLVYLTQLRKEAGRDIQIAVGDVNGDKVDADFQAVDDREGSDYTILLNRVMSSAVGIKKFGGPDQYVFINAKGNKIPGAIIKRKDSFGSPKELFELRLNRAEFLDPDLRKKIDAQLALISPFAGPPDEKTIAAANELKKLTHVFQAIRIFISLAKKELEINRQGVELGKQAPLLGTYEGYTSDGMYFSSLNRYHALVGAIPSGIRKQFGFFDDIEAAKAANAPDAAMLPAELGFGAVVSGIGVLFLWMEAKAVRDSVKENIEYYRKSQFKSGLVVDLMRQLAEGPGRDAWDDPFESSSIFFHSRIMKNTLKAMIIEDLSNNSSVTFDAIAKYMAYPDTKDKEVDFLHGVLSSMKEQFGRILDGSSAPIVVSRSQSRAGHEAVTALLDNTYQVKETSDKAQNGGIDIKNIDVNKTGTSKIKFNEDTVRDVLKNGFNGFTPVIINITPIASPLVAMGITDPAITNAPQKQEMAAVVARKFDDIGNIDI